MGTSKKKFQKPLMKHPKRISQIRNRVVNEQSDLLSNCVESTVINITI